MDYESGLLSEAESPVLYHIVLIRTVPSSFVHLVKSVNIGLQSLLEVMIPALVSILEVVRFGV